MSYEVLTKLRAAGWSVAVHNDYRVAGEAMTFWLFTHPDGRWIKGEGATDAEALAECEAAASPTSAPVPPQPDATEPDTEPRVTCPSCDGWGRHGPEACWLCGATGKVPRSAPVQEGGAGRAKVAAYIAMLDAHNQGEHDTTRLDGCDLCDYVASLGPPPSPSPAEAPAADSDRAHDCHHRGYMMVTCSHGECCRYCYAALCSDEEAVKQRLRETPVTCCPRCGFDHGPLPMKVRMLLACGKCGWHRDASTTPAETPGEPTAGTRGPPTWFAQALIDAQLKDRITADAKLACDFGDGCPPDHPTHGRCVPCKARSVVAGRCCATNAACPTPTGCFEALSCQASVTPSATPVGGKPPGSTTGGRL